MSGVTLASVIKRYGDTQVIHGVDLQIEDGEFCVLVGPSGCGKSTCIQLLQRFYNMEAGALVRLQRVKITRRAAAAGIARIELMR